MFLALYKGNKKSLTQQLLHESPLRKSRTAAGTAGGRPHPRPPASLGNSLVCTDGAGVRLIPGWGGGGGGLRPAEPENCHLQPAEVHPLSEHRESGAGFRLNCREKDTFLSDSKL